MLIWVCKKYVIWVCFVADLLGVKLNLSMW